jgi:hypothetical protein
MIGGFFLKRLTTNHTNKKRLITAVFKDYPNEEVGTTKDTKAHEGEEETSFLCAPLWFLLRLFFVPFAWFVVISLFSLCALVVFSTAGVSVTFFDKSA